FLSKAIAESWFSIPVTTFAFAAAMHLTDVRPAIVRGIRNLLLVLLSWILPVLALLVGGFLASLLFTGLEPLWATRRASAVLLGAAAAFVVLINAAWQNGSAPVARLVALSARAAALLLVPVTALAVYALVLRVQDHGWSDDRVIAAACMLVAACYAGGYAAAALRKGWLASIAGVNIAAAFVVLGVVLLLFSPLGDPDRLSTRDQMARLASGRVTAAGLDIAYLHFDAARYGRAALAQLEAQTGRPDAAQLRSRIAAVRKLPNRHMRKLLDAAAPDLAANLHVWPQGAHLPDSFMKTDWRLLADAQRIPACLVRSGKSCDALLLDLGGDARPEVMLFGAEPWDTVFATEDADGRWRIAGAPVSGFVACAGGKDALRAGLVRSVPPVWRDLEIAGRRIPLQLDTPPQAPCPPVGPAQRDAPPQ
ncbi:MAG: DUF4153 domain-containing protein, partial [Lysobacteraceae bacterium]